MLTNKIALIQVWFGKLPDYFEYHFQTCLTQKIDFYFFTDQQIDQKFHGHNVKFIKLTQVEYECKLFDRTGKHLTLPTVYKINDTKPAFPDIFQEYVKDYEFVGWYDIDTLLGDVTRLIEPYLEEYDIISFGENEGIYNRVSGPLCITLNTEKIRTVYLKDPIFYDCMSKQLYDEYDERKLTETYRKLGIRIKIMANSSNYDPKSGKTRFNAVWSGGKVIVDGEEKLLHHFYRKKLTKFEKKGNSIVASQKVNYIDDFLFITYFTENYEPTARILINTIEKFSRRKCLLYTVNYDSSLVHELSDQFIVRRINLSNEGDSIDSRGRSFNTITSKPVIQIDSVRAFPDKKFVFLDTDIYLTVGIDSITKYFDHLENYPLTNSHVHDIVYAVEPNGDLVSSVHSLGEEIGVEVTVFPRRKTNVMVYDSRSEWFFKEQMAIYNDHKHSTRRAIFRFHDEDTFNILLSKYNFRKALPMVDIEEVFDIDLSVYTNYTWSATPISDGVTVPKSDRDVYAFHGYKSPELFKKVDDTYGRTVLDKSDILVEYDGKDLTLTKNSFLLDKKISGAVDLLVKLGDVTIFKCGWAIFDSQIFCIWDLPLTKRQTYLVEITEQESGRLIFRTELITDF